jgi:hypothetical protein
MCDGVNTECSTSNGSLKNKSTLESVFTVEKENAISCHDLMATIVNPRGEKSFQICTFRIHNYIVMLLWPQ